MFRTKYLLSICAILITNISFAGEDTNILNDKAKYDYKEEIMDVSQIPGKQEELTLIKVPNKKKLITFEQDTRQPKNLFHAKGKAYNENLNDPRDDLPTLEKVIEKNLNT